MTRIAVALLHHPVVDKNDTLYTTAITNMDVHDIARSACTYDLSQYYVVSPITAQREMASTIANFWCNGSGAQKNRDRSRAMELLRIEHDLAACIAHEESLTGQTPLLIATSAKHYADKSLSYGKAQELMSHHKSTILILGTGHGLAPSVIEEAHHVLMPIDGKSDYNHLSVRSAAAIIFDRLFGLRSIQ